MSINKSIYRHMESDLHIMRSIAGLITFDTTTYEEISEEDLELSHEILKDLSNDLNMGILESSLESDKKRFFVEILGSIYIKYHNLTYKKKENKNGK